MKQIILFTGIHDWFGIYLAEVFMRKSFDIYCLGNSLSWNRIKALINFLPDDNRRNELLNCYQRIQKIEIDSIAQNLTLQDKDISLLHYDSCLLIAQEFAQEMYSFDKKNYATIKKLGEVLPIRSINYVSSLYESISSTENHGFIIKDQSFGETFFEDLGKSIGAYVHVYRTPVIYGEISSQRQDFSSLIAKKLTDNLQWVKNRIPDYFNNYKLHLLDNIKKQLAVVDLTSIAEQIANTCFYQSNFQIQINSNQNCDLSSTVNNIVMNETGYKPMLVKQKKDLNPIDKIINNNLTYFYPPIYQRDGTNLSGMVPHANGTVSSCTTYIKFNGHAEVKSIQSKNGKPLIYCSRGIGETVLIVNAYGVKADAWDALAELLSQYFHVIYWKVRGSLNNEKASGKEKDVYRMEHQIEDIESIVQAEKLTSFHLASWCSGAKVALFYHQKYPSQIKSLIFLAGEFAPFKGSEPYHSKFRQNLRFIAEIVENDEKMLDFYMKIIHKGMFNRPIKEYSSGNEQYIFEIMSEQHRDILLSPFESNETMVNFLKMCMEYYQYDITALLHNIQIPTLFLAAECDQIAPYMQSKWASSQVPNSKLLYLPSATHLIIMEQPMDVYNLIMQFMLVNHFIF